mgnify:CR=1 FL=1|jgi:hypothetical protein
MRRAQVSLFMIIGLVILVIAFFLIYIQSLQYENLDIIDEEIDVDTKSIELFVGECITNVALEGIYDNSLTGGYFLLPEHSTTELYDNLPYYYDFGNSFLPSDEILASEVAYYVDVMLDLCLDDFTYFKDQGYEISFEAPNSNALLDPNKLTINTNMPITLTSIDKTTQVSNFQVEVDAKQFYENILVSREIVETIDKGICLTCFSSLATEYDLFVGTIPYNDSIIIDIKDNNYFIDYENYHLTFAVRIGNEE